jgi:hypothetical protein
MRAAFLKGGIMSTRFLPLFGLLLITVFGVSCAQPGAGDGVLPTSPSSLSAGPSATAAGPGASYNASGMWRFVTADADGNVDEIFDTNVTQDVNGNLSFLDEEGTPITLERLGTGVIITYRLSLIGNGDECDLRIQGTVRLDTRANTMTGNVRLKELGCSNGREGVVVTGTKLS